MDPDVTGISSGICQSLNTIQFMTKTKSTNWAVIIGCILVIVAAVVVARTVFVSSVSEEPGEQFTTVEPRSFSAQIVERGIVRPAKISPISSMISSNQAKIVWILKEGSKVSKGALVARFDTKTFNDSLQKAEQLYGDAKATHMASQKLLRLQEEEEAGKIEEAERKVEIARIKSKNILKGSGPLKRKILVQKLNQAQRSLELSENEYEDLDTLLEKGHVSVRETEKAKDQVKTANEQVTVAQAEIDNFDKYVWPQMLREAELLVNAADSDFERVRRTAELLIQNRQAEVEKNRRKEQNKLLALNRAKQDIANCEVFSPANGILLYSTLPRENGRRKIQIGDSVWVGQTFLEVPDTNDLIAETHVREVDVAKIRVGMEAEIAVDAFPHTSFTGTVASIASLAKEDKNSNGVRRFYTRIRFTGNTDGIHVGMSVTARIIYDKVENAPSVPISSLVYRNGTPHVFAASSLETLALPVKIGVQNHMYAEIKTGVNVGREILLEP